MPAIFRTVVEPADEGPVRPSTFRETPEERTEIEPAPDYPTTESTGDYAYAYESQTEPDPIPVYQVQAPPVDRTYLNWSAATMTLNANHETQVSGANRDRKRLVIRNVHNTATIHVGPQSTIHGYLAFELRAGEEIEMAHNDAVWAKADEDGARITVLAEYMLVERVERGD